VRNGWTYI